MYTNKKTQRKQKMKGKKGKMGIRRQQVETRNKELYTALFYFDFLYVGTRISLYMSWMKKET